MISLRAVLIILSLTASSPSWGTTPRCPLSEREILKSVTGDLDGSGQQMRAVFFKCRFRSDHPDQLPEYVFGVSVQHAEKPEEEVAEWESAPTTIDAFYTEDDRVVQEPGSASKLITTSVQYAGKILTLSVFRLVHGALVPVGEWTGNGVEMRVLGGHLAITIGSPNLVELPKLLVWSDGRFVPSAPGFSKLYSILGEDYERQIDTAQMTTPVWLYTECALAFKAFSMGGVPERGRAACEAARTRLLHRRALRPYFPSDSSESKFATEIKEALENISALLSRTQGDRTEPSGGGKGPTLVQ